MPTERSHEISLDVAVADAFPLFTPKGEESWVPGWRPSYIEPPGGETVPEMLFRTGDGDETTFWTCLAFEPGLHHVRYLRVTPASRIAFVDVACRAGGPNDCIVRVSYRFVALNDAGLRYIDAMSPEAFAAMIEDWRHLIGTALSPRAQSAPIS